MDYDAYNGHGGLMRWFTPLAILAGLVLVGCGSRLNTDEHDAATPSTTTANVTQKPSSTPTTTPSRSPSRLTVSTQKPAAELTGFGATKEAWLAAHEQAPGFTENAAFLPMVERDGGSLPMYAGVSVETPVVDYIINLPNGTTLDDARRIVLAEFPRGAEFNVEDKDESACLIASIKSPPVQRGLRRHGYGNWVPTVAFFTHTATETRLDPENVTDVSMFVSEPSRNDLGLC